MQPAQSSSSLQSASNYDSTKASYLVNSAPPNVLLPVDVTGILRSFACASLENIPAMRLVCSQWKKWVEAEDNIKAVLEKFSPYRRDLQNHADPLVRKRAFLQLANRALRISNHIALKNSALSKGEVLECTFEYRETAPKSKQVNYQAFVIEDTSASHALMKMYYSDQSEPYKEYIIPRVTAAVYYHQNWFFSRNDQILQFTEMKQYREAARRNLFHEVKVLKADGDFLLGLDGYGDRLELMNHRTGQTSDIYFDNDRRIMAIEFIDGHSIIAFDDGEVQKQDRTKPNSSPTSLCSKKSKDITSMKIKERKLYMGDFDGGIKVLDLNTNTIERTVPKIHDSAIQCIAVEDCFAFTLSTAVKRSTIKCTNIMTGMPIAVINVDCKVSKIFYGLGMLAIGNEYAGLTSHDFNIVPAKERARALLSQTSESSEKQKKTN